MTIRVRDLLAIVGGVAALGVAALEWRWLGRSGLAVPIFILAVGVVLVAGSVVWPEHKEDEAAK